MNFNYLFIFLTLIAEIIGTIGGFGSSVFFVPIGSFFFDFHTVLGLTALLHLSSNLSKIVLFKKGLDKNLLFYLGIPAVIFVLLGSFLSKLIITYWLELFLGVFLVIFSLLFLIKNNLVFLPNKLNSIIGGILSGFSAGLLGTGGVIRGLVMNAYNLEKGVYVATSASIDMMIDLSRTVVYYNNGFIEKKILIYIPILFAIGLVGTYIGKKILNKIPQEFFRKISLVLILIIGIITLSQIYFR